MKKIIALMVSASLILALAGCKKSETETEVSDTTTVATEATEDETGLTTEATEATTVETTEATTVETTTEATTEATVADPTEPSEAALTLEGITAAIETAYTGAPEFDPGDFSTQNQPDYGIVGLAGHCFAYMPNTTGYMIFEMDTNSAIYQNLKVGDQFSFIDSNGSEGLATATAINGPFVLYIYEVMDGDWGNAHYAAPFTLPEIQAIYDAFPAA